MHIYPPNILSHSTSDVSFFLEMSNIQRPVQALVRQPRSAYEDDEQGQPGKVLLFSQRLQHPRSSAKLVQQSYALLQNLDLLAGYILRMPRPSSPSTLPSYHTPQNPQSFQLEGMAPINRVRKLQAAGSLHASGSSHRRIGDSEQTAQIRERRSPTSFGAKLSCPRLTREAKPDTRKDEILEILKPMIPKENEQSASILLCWGKQDQCQVLPVKVPHSVDPVALWHEIRRAWYAQRGIWRKYIPLYGVKEVSIVDITIAGSHPGCLSKGTFIGCYAREYLAARKKRLEQIVNDYRPQPDPCYYDPSSGFIECFTTCVSYISDEFECPERQLYSAERELSRLSLRRLLALAFSSPNLARANDLLSENLFFSEKDILSKLRTWHHPSLAELRFQGLLIVEGWLITPQHGVILSTAVTLLFVVLVAKLSFDDWSTAWTVGTVFLGMVALSTKVPMTS